MIMSSWLLSSLHLNECTVKSKIIAWTQANDETYLCPISERQIAMCWAAPYERSKG